MNYVMFVLGVRTLLVDKGNQPKWEPSKLTDVSDAIVDSHFEEVQTN